MASTRYIQHRLGNKAEKKDTQALDNQSNVSHEVDAQEIDLVPNTAPSPSPKFSDLAETLKNHLTTEIEDENVI